jgi:hypothetical protein
MYHTCVSTRIGKPEFWRIHTYILVSHGNKQRLFPQKQPIGNVLSFNHSFIHSSMALQPSVGPWPLLQLRNLFYTDGNTPWTTDQPVARPLPTHRTTQTE